MDSPTSRPLTELRAYLTGFATRCRTARWLGALFHVQVCEDIVTDEEQLLAQARQEAYRVEHADLEAARLIAAALKPHTTKSEEEKAIRHALRHLQNATRTARTLGDSLAA